MLYFLDQFIPSKKIMPLKHKRLLGGKRMSKGSGEANPKQKTGVKRLLLKSPGRSVN